jgi:hypothetical protein
VTTVSRSESVVWICSRPVCVALYSYHTSGAVAELPHEAESEFVASTVVPVYQMLSETTTALAHVLFGGVSDTFIEYVLRVSS